MRVRLLAILALLALSMAMAAPAAARDQVGLVDPTTGQWFLRDDGGGTTSFYYGVPGDVPIVGDWNCDGIDTPGMYRRSNGFVYLRNSNTQGVGEISYFFGDQGDIPLAGDWNGNGCDTVSIYRPSEGRVYVINHLGTAVADYSYYFGNPGDKPFAGDFNGDGVDTVGLHRESSGSLYFRNSNTQGVADFDFFYGNPGDRLFAGDWTNDGTDTFGVFRPSESTFYLRYTNTQGFADEQFIYGSGHMLPVAGFFGVSGGAAPPPSDEQVLASVSGGGHSSSFSVSVPWRVDISRFSGSGTCYVGVNRASDGAIEQNANFEPGGRLQMRATGSFSLEGINSGCTLTAVTNGSSHKTSLPVTVGQTDSLPFDASSPWQVSASRTSGSGDCYYGVHRDSDGEIEENGFLSPGNYATIFSSGTFYLEGLSSGCQITATQS
jgi:hypothetical protein